MGRKRGSRNAQAPIADQAKEAPAKSVAANPAPVTASGTTEPTVAGANALTPAASTAAADQVQAGHVTGGDAPAVLSVAPLYQSHKQVRALKLSDVERNNDTGQVLLTPEDKSFAPFEPPSNWYGRYSGSDSDTGYFVQYEDGFASWSPSKPFEDGYSLMSSDDELAFRAPLVVAELARGVGAAARYFANGGGSEPDIFTTEEAAIMADFVRDNREAPVEAMFIHLGLQKRYPRTVPNTADRFVLGLFHAACVAAFTFEGELAAEEAARRETATFGGWPGDRALKPQDPAFAPTGFSPR
ncbi:hypothetical protein [Mesorhizobium sp. B1-1-7]|uniref:hypothetical protein n=1 Tax=Mesorhizobium sp. B1-1-7 TaxID=2589977 RepID=UPI00112C0862|nr:hypothetical protein [Mesorhizobium sp. B1-1-7]TPN57159.1 hypothetical protein FJ978_00620 [Mesorhizobium sp. B1-1-7]